MREVLLQELEELERLNELKPEQRLLDALVVDNRFVKRLVVRGLVELALLHQESARRLVEQVRLAVDGQAVLERDALHELARLELDGGSALGGEERLQQHGERALREVALPRAAELLQFLGVDHGWTSTSAPATQVGSGAPSTSP